jgi:hypothetical protein
MLHALKFHLVCNVSRAGNATRNWLGIEENFPGAVAKLWTTLLPLSWDWLPLPFALSPCELSEIAGKSHQDFEWGSGWSNHFFG